jgi:hypothetical protein
MKREVLWSSTGKIWGWGRRNPFQTGSWPTESSATPPILPRYDWRPETSMLQSIHFQHTDILYSCNLWHHYNIPPMGTGNQSVGGGGMLLHYMLPPKTAIFSFQLL